MSPYLFALVMDEVTRDIQCEIPWCMLFADDVVLVDESRAGVNRKVSGVVITCPDKRRRILVHILNEDNVFSWDFVLLQSPPHDISRYFVICLLKVNEDHVQVLLLLSISLHQLSY